jgi:hypothetical protein
MKALIEKIKTQEKMAVFSEETNIPLDYLEILKREINSYQPKPIILSDIPEINPDHIERLSIAGIKNTKQLFEKTLLREEREKLSDITGIDYSSIVELAKMADISRIRWVGPLFVRIIIITGIDTVEKITNTSPVLFFDKIMEAIKIKNYKNVNNITAGDIGRCIEYAKKLETGLVL